MGSPHARTRPIQEGKEMTIKEKEATIICAICGMFFMLCIFWAAIFPQNKEGDVRDTEVPVLIPTKHELQQALVDAGYDIGPKGVDGDIGTDTIKAWDMYICDQFAAAEFERMEK